MGPGAPRAGSVVGAADDGSPPTWQDRELVAALRRLALARSQLDTLTEAMAAAAPPPAFDHEALRALEAVHEELVHARDRARSRFGGHARHRLAELEARQDALLGQLRATSLVEAQGLEVHPPPAPAVDPAVVEFARHEVAAATKAVTDLVALDLPDPAPAASPSPGDDGGAAAVDLPVAQQAG